MRKTYTLLALCLLLSFGAIAQNNLDIEHLMDGTYSIKREIYPIKFTDNNHFIYFDVKSRQNMVFNTKNFSCEKEALLEENKINNDNKAFLEENKISGHQAFVRDNNIFVYFDGKEKQITFDGDSINIIYGQSVHRNEFGIEKGLFFSDNGRYLAYYRMDQSMVGDYPLVNTMEREAKLMNIKYPMAGMKSHEVLVYVYDFNTEKTTLMQTREDESLEQREMYLTNLAFSPSGEILYIQKLNRLQNHMYLEAYHSLTGKKDHTLFEEVSQKYFEPEHPIVFLPNNPKQFLYFSERDGFDHLYLYDIDGNLIKQVTKGDWMVNEIAGFNAKGTECYFYATKDSPLERNLYSVNLKNNKITRITPDHGTHYVIFNEEGTRFVDSYTSKDVAWRTVLLDNKGKVLKELQNCADPFASLDNSPTISIDTLHAADGTLLYTRMIKPKNFDANKKYPVIIYVYNGPHAQLITDSWTCGAGNFLPFLATQDYIVWTLDGRGSANRGYEFESAIWHQCGKAEISDQMRGVEYLKSLPYVDADRIGVDGWSYGGFMTLSMTLRNPGVFKVATAGGPVIDWKWYEVMYGERYMGTPENNPDGYKTSSVLSYIDNIPEDVHILVMQGYLDNTVVAQHSLEFIRQCVEKKKPVDYFMYTNHEHNVRGRDRVELYKKIFNYYQDYLK